MKKPYIAIAVFFAIAAPVLFAFYGEDSTEYLKRREAGNISRDRFEDGKKALKSELHCSEANQSETAYLLDSAENGNPVAQYIAGTFYSQKQRMYYHRYGIFKANPQLIKKDDATAKEWWSKAAEQNEPHAQSVLGLVYQEEKNYEKAFFWLTKAANQGDKTSALFLSTLYQQGLGVAQSDEEAYFWASVGHGQYKKDLAAKILTAQQKEALDKRAKEWKPTKIFSDSNQLDTNIHGLACGNVINNCQMVDICGDLIGIVCSPGRNPKYMIASKSKNQIISSCPEQGKNCLSLIPEEWTCLSPRNMPLSPTDQAKYPKFKYSISCGEIFGAGHVIPASDADYLFVSKDTEKIIGSCGFFGGPCKPPAGWTCGRPSNYRG